jgi:hypothetical protein
MVYDPKDLTLICKRLAEQAAAGQIRFTLHAHQEMVADGVVSLDVLDVFKNGQIIENYPEHQRGACCLVCGHTAGKRVLHVCCTSVLEVAIIITVYEPRLPKWETPYKRRE